MEEIDVRNPLEMVGKIAAKTDKRGRVLWRRVFEVAEDGSIHVYSGQIDLTGVKFVDQNGRSGTCTFKTWKTWAKGADVLEVTRPS